MKPNKSIIIVCLIVLTICITTISGCIEDPEYKDYTIKEKFQSITPCQKSSATTYYVLTTTGETIKLASTCDKTSGGIQGLSSGMDFYWVWEEVNNNSQIHIESNTHDIFQQEPTLINIYIIK